MKHSDLEAFVQTTLSKREPCPAIVLAWGWALKMGEGGVFHNDTFKQRYFVLARVPHATVLIYYAGKLMDEEGILGYIDLRKVNVVREGERNVTLDGGKSPASAIVSRIKGGFLGKTDPHAASRPVLELQTSGRTYVVAPVTIQMPPPMTTSMALGPATTGRPLYLFGWPFPVPTVDETDDEAEVAKAVEEGRISKEAFDLWKDVIATAVAAEKATRVFPVLTLVDSSAQLPQRVLLRTTPCELAIINVDDKDVCFNAIPYNDLLKWEVQVDTELHITARTRARLVARQDRSGFTTQRPTRPTSHFVFKSAAAKQMATAIDNHIGALAKQLGVSEDGGGDTEDVEDDEPGAMRAAASSRRAADDGDGDMAPGNGKKLSRSQRAMADDDDPPRKAASGKKSSSKKASAASDEDEDGPPVRKPSSGQSKKAASSAKKPASDDDSDGEGVLRSRKESGSGKKSSSSRKAAKQVDSDEDTHSPRKGGSSVSKKASKAKAVSSDDDDGFAASSKGKGGKKSAKKADSDGEEAPSRKGSGSKKPAKKADSDTDEAPVRKTSSKAKSPKVDSEADGAKSKKTPTKKADTDEDEKDTGSRKGATKPQAEEQPTSVKETVPSDADEAPPVKPPAPAAADSD